MTSQPVCGADTPLRFRRAALVAALVIATGACTSVPGALSMLGAPEQVLDRLYFGRAQPDGQEVSEQQWTDFLDQVVTPRFPQGLTVLSGQGQWRGADSRIASERSYVIELVHGGSAPQTADVRAIVATYKRRFRQEAVMWLRQPVQATF